MFKVDCSTLPQAVTDFAFDHLADDVEADSIELEYEAQIVHVDTGDMKLASEVQNAIQSRAVEKVSDMKSEANRGYDVGFTEQELDGLQRAVHEHSNFELKSE